MVPAYVQKGGRAPTAREIRITMCALEDQTVWNVRIRENVSLVYVNACIRIQVQFASPRPARVIRTNVRAMENATANVACAFARDAGQVHDARSEIA